MIGSSRKLDLTILNGVSDAWLTTGLHNSRPCGVAQCCWARLCSTCDVSSATARHLRRVSNTILLFRAFRLYRAHNTFIKWTLPLVSDCAEGTQQRIPRVSPSFRRRKTGARQRCPCCDVRRLSHGPVPAHALRAKAVSHFWDSNER